MSDIPQMIPDDLVSMATKPRRLKRAVPDAEKNEQYWKRRCMNNIAAKKSRANKRQQEYMLQLKVVNLEEENALLKKELEVLKKNLKIPDDVDILSEKQHEHCLRSVFSNTDLNRDDLLLQRIQVKKENIDTFVDGIAPSNLPRHLIPVVNLVPAHTGSHSNATRKQPASIDVTSGMTSTMFNGPLLDLANFRGCSNVTESNTCATDLSMKKSTPVNVSNTSPDVTAEKVLSKESYYSKINDNNTSTSVEEEVTTINDEIKTKLQRLSDQVERMQRLVCVTDSDPW